MYLFATKSSEYLAKSLAKALRGRLGQVERFQFENTERYMRITKPAMQDLVGQDAFIVASVTNDDELLEVYRLGCTVADAGTRRRIFVIPYLAYSTMEVAKNEGEVVTAKTNARLLSSLPKSTNNTFIFLDLHEPSLRHYFEGDVTVLEISAIELLAKAIKRERIANPVVGSADLGMPLQTQTLAQLLKADVALVSKSREFSHTAVLAAVGDVKDRNVVIYDDMVRSGSSLIQAAEAYKKAGAKDVWAAISHFTTSDHSVAKKLRQSPIKKIITTNSHPASQHIGKTVDITPLVSPVIKQLVR